MPYWLHYCFCGLLSTSALANPDNTFPLAAKPQSIVVADLFGDLKQQFENKAREVINRPTDSGASRAEQANLPVTQNSYPVQAEAAPPQAKQSKKMGGELGAGPALPPLPYIERDQEVDLSIGKWRLLQPYPLYANEGGGKVIKTLPKGLKVDGLSLAVHTLSYATAELKKPLTRQFSGHSFNQTTRQRELFTISLQRRDKIVYLSYLGEGECAVWVKGHTYVSGCFDDDDEMIK